MLGIEDAVTFGDIGLLSIIAAGICSLALSWEPIHNCAPLVGWNRHSDDVGKKKKKGKGTPPQDRRVKAEAFHMGHIGSYRSPWQIFQRALCAMHTVLPIETFPMDATLEPRLACFLALGQGCGLTSNWLQS
jgi:hypothetical protein